MAAVGLQRQLPETGGREGSAAQDVATLGRKSGLETKIAKNWHGRTTFLKSQAAKFAPGCGESAVWKSNSLKDGMMGALLEGQVGKNLHHAAARERLGSKIVKGCGGVGSLFS